MSLPRTGIKNQATPLTRVGSIYAYTYVDVHVDLQGQTWAKMDINKMSKSPHVEFAALPYR